MLFDYAPDIKYYTSDVTRMFPANGKFTPAQREMYGVYVKLYQALMSSIGPGRRRRTPAGRHQKMTSASSRRSRSPIRRSKRPRRASSPATPSPRNSYGHWVGLEVHDVSGGQFDGVYKPGMVFTIEPALTIRDERVYIRLEDVILITRRVREPLRRSAHGDRRDREADGRTEPFRSRAGHDERIGSPIAPAIPGKAGLDVKQGSGLKAPIASLALFVLLAVVHTWPLATDPGRLSRNDSGDTVHQEWILAWVAHQLAHDPLHLFDSNVFYPERDTLAYSDHLLVQALMAAPLLWSGASPVLAYNLVLIAGLALTGWTTSLVVGRWTGNRMAGILSGSLMAFNALTLTRFPEIQDQHLEFFPLALWALDRLLTMPRVRYAVHLAGWFVLQALTCGYLLVFTSLSLVAAVAARPADWVGPRFRRTAGLLLLSAGIAVLALTPFLLPYLRVSREQGFTRSSAEVSQFSARFTDYLATGGRLHFSLWSHRFFDQDALFPGLIASGLVIAAVVGRQRVERPACADGDRPSALLAFAMSFGPAFPLYEALSRACSRSWPAFGAPCASASCFSPRLPFSRDSDWPCCSSVGGVEPSRSASCCCSAPPRSPARALPVPPLPGYLANLRQPPDERSRGDRLLSVPAAARGLSQNVDCMLASTRFWHPLVNGYSSFIPERYNRARCRARRVSRWRTTIQYLRQLGVTKVIVFTGKLSAPRLAHLSAHPELSLWKADKIGADLPAELMASIRD